MCPGYDCNKRECAIYDNRLKDRGAACIKLRPDIILGLHEAGILPDSCGYVSFMQGTPAQVADDFLCLPFQLLDRNAQRDFRRACKRWHKDKEGSLSKLLPSS